MRQASVTHSHFTCGKRKSAEFPGDKIRHKHCEKKIWIGPIILTIYKRFVKLMIHKSYWNIFIIFVNFLLFLCLNAKKFVQEDTFWLIESYFHFKCPLELIQLQALLSWRPRSGSIFTEFTHITFFPSQS